MRLPVAGVDVFRRLRFFFTCGSPLEPICRIPFSVQSFNAAFTLSSLFHVEHRELGALSDPPLTPPFFYRMPQKVFSFWIGLNSVAATRVNVTAAVWVSDGKCPACRTIRSSLAIVISAWA